MSGGLAINRRKAAEQHAAQRQDTREGKEFRIMKDKSILFGFCLVAFAVSAAAQTVTGSGTTNTVPVFTGTSTVGNSPISVSGSNVGIGTTSPQRTLDVNGFINSTGLFVLGGQGAYVGDGSTSKVWIGGSGGRNYFESGNNDWSASPLLYFTGYNASSGTFAFNGAVGIGTTSPQNVLDIGAISHAANQTGGATIRDTANYWPVNLNLISNASGVPRFSIGGLGGGISEIMTLAQTGNVGIGTTSPNATLEVNGTAQVDGALNVGNAGIVFPNGGGTQTAAYTGVTCGGDYAESVDVTGDRTKYEPGDVLVIDPDHDGRFLKSAEPYSTAVTGIYSTKPGTLGRRQTGPKNPDEVPMAMIGIVPTNVSAENGPIHRGDLLVSSSTIGYAMKGTDRSRMTGAVIGKALGNLESGKGVIEVVVTLQ
jgi:hypothetical protein